MCGAGFFQSAACTGTSDTVCGACHPTCTACAGPALEDCGKLGAKFAIVFTSGFGEIGKDGRDVGAHMRAIVQRTGMRIYGPNCPGLNNINGKLGMSFSPAYRLDRMPGPIGAATQGGGLGRAFIQSAMARGVGTGLWCSGGNEADLEVSDYIHYMADAPDIKVIVTTLEGVRNGPRFMAAALHAARRGKPIVALVAGRHAPRLRRMGHAGAFTSERTGSADRKIEALRAAGVVIAPNAHNVGELMRETLRAARSR